jgi:formylglycine-generating enzyme required for sulfatase activity
VSWEDVQAFLAVLNERDPGKGYRLPTEAEWEYATRAGTTGDYGVSGDLDDIAWYEDNSMVNGIRQPHPVALKKPNAWGLYDLHGNVAEWVKDWFDYYGANPETDDPVGPTSGAGRVIRGGAWASPPNGLRSAYRDGQYPNYRRSRTGFRLVRHR